MYKDSIKKFILATLLVLAVVLGVFIYKKNNASTSGQASNTNIVTKIDNSKFSPDEIKLLIPPGPDAGRAEIDEHSKLAAKLAVIGSQVEIKDCKASPIVLQTKFGSKVTFKNNSDYNIRVSFDDNNVIDLSAGKSVSTDKVFTHGQGLYGYLCRGGDFTGLIGFVLLTP